MDIRTLTNTVSDFDGVLTAYISGDDESTGEVVVFIEEKNISFELTAKVFSYIQKNAHTYCDGLLKMQFTEQYPATLAKGSFFRFTY